MDFSSFENVVHFLDHRPTHKHYSLESIRHLLQETETTRLPSYVIHVAGTNGKGSVCAILAHVYQKAGYSVGFYSSPHLIDIRERIQISGQCISKKDFVEQFFKIHKIAELLKEKDSKNFTSHFEYLTAMALSFFREKCPDIVILETGMGGRHDATTATTADMTVITTIHYDHQCYLGQTLSEISYEKAGILLPHVPLVLGHIQGEALDVIQTQAQKLEVPINYSSASDISDAEWRQSYAHLPLYQRDNMATARAVVQCLQERFPLSSFWNYEASQFYWPCRWECFRNHVDEEIILDGAHNPEGAQAVLQEIERHKTQGKPFRQLIFGSIEISRARAMLDLLHPHFEEIFLIADGYERHLSREEFQSCISENMASKTRIISFEEAGELWLTKGKKLTTGSLYMLGSLLAQYRSFLTKV
jgi:dihydrofolate synthase/folylpolyglutamate synthase